jgi:TolB-like protein/predicted Ser/Thr protein kinase
MPFSPGDSLGPYEIVSLLGRGGMGEVWKARDTRLNRDVAIKVSEQQFSGRFEREARAIAALNHPNICTLYDIGPNYLVMEFIEGLPPRGPQPPAQAVTLALGIAAGLEAAHAKGITHRDLKPANILVTQSGLKLLDFGLALIREDNGIANSDAVTQAAGLTVPGTVLGTAAYMSPEQAQAKSADARSDIFSFGLVLYELLSGRRAFPGDSAIEVMAAIVRDEPAPLNAPTKLAEIVTRCLQKAPAARFQTVHEVRMALEQVNTVRADGTPSIAVLPFANLSADKENEYFSDGLAEEILNLLAKIPGLKVIARTSSFAFRGKDQDITKIAEALRVRTILEGSVRRAGNRIRVTAQLIEAENGSHLWSERYDRDMTDIFAIQDEIGQAISEALKVRLAPRARAVNIEAWQNYLKGHYHFLRLTPENIAKGIDFFGRAVAIDPHYAPAHNGLARCYHASWMLGWKPMADMAPLAESAVQKVLAIDPADSEAASVLAVMAATCDYDWKRAEIYFRTAFAVEPVPHNIRYEYIVFYLHPLGRFAEAMEQSRRALETDPLYMVLHFAMALSLYASRQYRETIEYVRRALDIDATLYLIWIAMGLAQLASGSAQEAITSFERVVDLAPWYSSGVAYLAAACWLAGDRERSKELTRKFNPASGLTGTAYYHAVTGEVDAMFEALDAAWRQRDSNLSRITTSAFFDPYRADPRFQALLRRMNRA